MWADIDTNKDFLNYSEVAELAIDVIPQSANASSVYGRIWNLGDRKVHIAQSD